MIGHLTLLLGQAERNADALFPNMDIPWWMFIVYAFVAIALLVGLVLLVFVLGMNLIATLIRSRARAKRQW